MDKATLRAQARAGRRALPAPEREARSARIREHALALPELSRARRVGCYVSVGNEVDTRMLLRALLVADKLVAVPVTLGERLQFVRLEHPWALQEVGAHGIPEPRQPWREIAGESLDVLFVPGLLFGRDGSRLGMGGGHFDRFLRQHPTPLRVGLAFAPQLVDAVPSETHDEGMDVVVTEEGRVRIGRPAGERTSGPS